MPSQPRAQVTPGNASDVEMLVDLVRGGLPAHACEDAKRQDAALSAATALTSLACDAHYRKSIALAGGIEPLVGLTRDGNTEQQSAAAAALKMLAFQDMRNKQLIGQACAIEPLVALLAPCDTHGGNAAARCEMAAAALCNLAHEVALRKKIAEAGAVEPLVAILYAAKDGCPRKENSVALASIAALNNLAVDSDANRRAIAEAGAIELLVRFARNGTEQQRRQAELALQNLAHDNDDNLIAISKAVHAEGLTVDVFQQMADRSEERVARAREQAARERELARRGEAWPTAQHEWLVAAEAAASVHPSAQHEWLVEAEAAASEHAEMEL